MPPVDLGQDGELLVLSFCWRRDLHRTRCWRRCDGKSGDLGSRAMRLFAEDIINQVKTSLDGPWGTTGRVLGFDVGEENEILEVPAPKIEGRESLS